MRPPQLAASFPGASVKAMSELTYPSLLPRVNRLMLRGGSNPEADTDPLYVHLARAHSSFDEIDLDVVIFLDRTNLLRLVASLRSRLFLFVRSAV